MTAEAGRNASVTRTTTGLAEDAKRWEKEILSHIRRATKKPGWFGSIHLEIVDGRVHRCLVERSIKSPEDLAQVDSDV